RIPDGGLQGRALRRVLPRRRLERNVVQDGGHPGIQERGAQRPAGPARADRGSGSLDSGGIPGRGNGRPFLPPWPYHGKRAGWTTDQGEGTHPAVRARSLRDSAALTHAWAGNVPAEISRLPGSAAGGDGQSGRGAQKGSGSRERGEEIAADCADTR